MYRHFPADSLMAENHPAWDSYTEWRRERQLPPNPESWQAFSHGWDYAMSEPIPFTLTEKAAENDRYPGGMVTNNGNGESHF